MDSLTKRWLLISLVNTLHFPRLHTASVPTYIATPLQKRASRMTPGLTSVDTRPNLCAILTQMYER